MTREAELLAALIELRDSIYRCDIETMQAARRIGAATRRADALIADIAGCKVEGA